MGSSGHIPLGLGVVLSIKHTHTPSISCTHLTPTHLHTYTHTPSRHALVTHPPFGPGPAQGVTSWDPTWQLGGEGWTTETAGQAAPRGDPLGVRLGAGRKDGFVEKEQFDQLIWGRTWL